MTTSRVRKSTGRETPVIRPALREDLSAVEELLRRSALPLEGVREALPDFFVAEADGAVVGVAGYEACCAGSGPNALLRSVAVAEEWRGRGLGRELVQRVIAEAERRGTRALYLLTTTAEAYFPSFGFQQVSRDELPDDVRGTQEFRTACPESAIAMCRPVAS
ncbi:MAG TPA: arsenic resistance N-acetyltransferase ArsN2 [Gemmatimonadaceae bacterium]|nr:arsenic resistance N-acetyltransferase ArsN2 [Gemmatimonadaceae bacterium]